MSELEDHQEATKPKAPEGLKAALEESAAAAPVTPPSGTPRVVVDSAAVTPPRGIPAVVVAPAPGNASSCLSGLMFLAAIGIASCMAVTIISLAGVAGLRDEWRAVGTQAASTTVAEVATQYHLANQDLAAGNVELSLIRLQDVATKMPDYQNAASLLPTVQAMSSFTPTASPSPSPTLPAATLTPTAATVQSDTAPADADQTANSLDPAELFGRAETAYTVGLYEEAIEWYDTLALVDPSYRRDEVQTKRVDAMIRLGTSYLRGTNSDGEDRLSQGIQLIWRADELGDVPGEVLYEADFVARYLSARGMVEGGANAQALEVLTRLCEEDCDWSYGGVSVRALLSQAGGVPN